MADVARIFERKELLVQRGELTQGGSSPVWCREPTATPRLRIARLLQTFAPDGPALLGVDRGDALGSVTVKRDHRCLPAERQGGGGDHGQRTAIHDVACRGERLLRHML